MAIALRVVVLLLGVGLLLALPSTAAITGTGWSLLPPLVAITLALAVRGVLVSLLVGVTIVVLLAVGQRTLGLRDALEAVVGGLAIIGRMFAVRRPVSPTS